LKIWKDTGDEGTWFRTLEKRDGMALVHYWYTPDSADMWMPEAQNYAEPEVRTITQYCACFCQKYLRVTTLLQNVSHHQSTRDRGESRLVGYVMERLYNEWMNEVNYVFILQFAVIIYDVHLF